MNARYSPFRSSLVVEILSSRKKIAWVLLSFSIVSFTVCVISLFYGWYITKFYSRAQGRVIELKASSMGDGENAYHPIFSFIDGKGQEHTVHSGIGSAPAQQKVGDIIPILYPPSQPEKARLGGNPYVWGLSVASAVPGFLLLSVGSLILFWPALVGRFTNNAVDSP